MLRDYSSIRLLWTKHAAAEVLEDDFDVHEIEKALKRVAELPEINGEKKRGVVRIADRYCTLIYKKKKHGLIIITCWESNRTDVSEYKHILKQKKRGVR